MTLPGERPVTARGRRHFGNARAQRAPGPARVERRPRCFPLSIAARLPFGNAFLFG
jgi:hypothetical protein